ncbi:MAG: enolase C-terminal domain-like protein [Parvibaculum sp.]|nr:enolase C-terminal domain-like protein [Parvibaculum sp.]
MDNIKITGWRSHDVRFPTSGGRHGSDAMNKDPDYSAAYIVLETNRTDLAGHGLTFTIGRGNDLCVKAAEMLAGRLVGQRLADITGDMAGFWRAMTGDSQMRWLGPDKGVVHLATGAVVNAVWDLWAKAEAKPLWQLVADMTPAEILACVDFRYLTNAITHSEALNILERAADGKQARIATLKREGYPAYTTSAGWLGYDDALIAKAARAAHDAGFRHFKLKVGQSIDDDKRRAAILRGVIGADCRLMFDANQVWEVSEAIAAMKELSVFDPWFIEEPTSPDDILGHAEIRAAIAPIKVATGEMCQNRIMFKQFMQADALDIVQIDAVRVGGLNENLATMLMAAKFNKLVCPHAGGVGLCEYSQHLSMIDYLVISGEMEGRVCEYVDHLHEHFISPCIVSNGHYVAPVAPGFSIEMKQSSIDAFTFRG